MVFDLPNVSLFFFKAGAWAQGRTLISIMSLYSAEDEDADADADADADDEDDDIKGDVDFGVACSGVGGVASSSAPSLCIATTSWPPPSPLFATIVILSNMDLI